MTRPIRILGYRLDKAGKLVKDQRRLDVSARLRQKASKRVRVVRPVVRVLAVVALLVVLCAPAVTYHPSGPGFGVLLC